MTAVYGLIGYPLGHSFSQSFFTQKFESEGIDARYLNFEIEDIGDLGELLAEQPHLRGLNVTIPYKEQVIPYLSTIDPLANRVGAVNVIKVDNAADRVTLLGFNSDVYGFGESLAPLLTPQRKRALILGTGGASKAVAVALQDLGIEFVKVSRTPREGVLTYGDLDSEVMSTHLIIINTTPVGMYPDVNSCPDIPYQMLTPEHLCYDLLYNPDITLFMKKAQEYGAETKNGLEMLLLQAFKSWQIWNEK